MLEGGEDPRFIARRMVILASEDVGNADPQALVVATAAAGRRSTASASPSAALNLAQAAAYLALAPKSNASYARDRAGRRATFASTAPSCRPTTCATRTTRAPRSSAAASGYVYPHDEPGGVAGQPVIPEALEGERFYEPTDRGAEAELGRRLDEIRRRREEPSG